MKVIIWIVGGGQLLGGGNSRSQDPLPDGVVWVNIEWNNTMLNSWNLWGIIDLSGGQSSRDPIRGPILDKACMLL